MGEPRKVFRIEQTAAARHRECSEHSHAPANQAELIISELSALHATLASAATARQSDNNAAAGAAAAMRLASELDRLAGTIGLSPDQHAASIARIGRELEAVVTGTEQATQKVLAAAEEIDQLAKNLSAALKGKIERGIAHDIQDFVIKIFEACNFQDLAGQRINKVMATLQVIEERIASLIDALKSAATMVRCDDIQHLHGPRLDFDLGHASQADIDALFYC